MSIYDRQTVVPNSRKIAVIGCGGVGYWVALIAAMYGVDRLILFDDDVVEESNLNRLPIATKDIGKPKSLVLKKHIKSLRDNTIIFTPGMWHKDSIINYEISRRSYPVFDCTDKIKVQKEIRKMYPRAIKLGYNGFDFSLINKEVKIVDISNEDGYSVPSNVITPIILAGIAIYKIFQRIRAKEDDFISLSIDSLFTAMVEKNNQINN